MKGRMKGRKKGSTEGKNMKVKTRIKICGIRSPEELELAARFGADAVGFLTEVPVESPRKIDSMTAAALVEQVPKGLDSVLVIMPENSARALELIDNIGPDIVQVHSELSLPELEMIRDKTGLPIIKALSVPAGKEYGKNFSLSPLLEKLRELEYSGAADAVLLDSGKGNRTGGTGLVHDWDLSRRIVEETSLPVILAGGLRPENVQEAIGAVSPYAVDTASGVETGGKKDALKIKIFMEAVRYADAFL